MGKRTKAASLKLKIWGGSLKDKRKCYFCEKQVSFDNATIEHLIPKARGGGDSLDNLVIACSPCNFEKGDMLPREFTFYRSPLGFLMRVFFVRRDEFQRYRRDARVTLDARFRNKEAELTQQLNNQYAEKIKDLEVERDNYRKNALILARRLLKLEKYLGVKVVDGEFVKPKKKDLNEINAQEALKFTEKEIVQSTENNKPLSDEEKKSFISTGQ